MLVHFQHQLDKNLAYEGETITIKINVYANHSTPRVKTKRLGTMWHRNNVSSKIQFTFSLLLFMTKLIYVNESKYLVSKNVLKMDFRCSSMLQQTRFQLSTLWYHPLHLWFSPLLFFGVNIVCGIHTIISPYEQKSGINMGFFFAEQIKMRFS